MNIPQGPWYIDDLLTFTVITTVFSTGVATDADAVPAYRVYEDETGTPILTGNMALLDSANTAGLYSEQITLSAANGFEVGKTYSIYVAATVSGVVGASSGGFKVIAVLATAADLATVAGYLDTEIAAIKTKTDFLPSATAGAAGGLFIAGSNAATTVASWTSTGLTLYSNGVQIAAPSTANRPGLDITGNGTGAGIKVIGGATGDGVRLDGGATSGNGLRSDGGAGGGHGATFNGNNSGHGISCVGDIANFGIGFLSSGYAGMWLAGHEGLHIQTNLGTETAVFIQGGGDTASGIVVTGGVQVTGPTTGDALALIAGTGSNGNGLSAAGDGTGLDITAPVNDLGASVAGDVWDVTLAAHLGAGSTGAALNAAGSAGDPWITALPGAYGAGSAGFIVGTNLDAQVSAGNTLSTAIKAKTDQLVFTVANKVDSNIKSVNDVTVTGTGAAGNEWGP